MVVTGVSRLRGSSAACSAWPLHSYLEVPARPESVCSARRHARGVLREWNLEALTETAELLISEITTNAVRATAGLPGHGEAPVCVWLTSDRSSLLIQVWDGDHRPPRPRCAKPDHEAGRGLLLVEALSVEWGCQTSEAAPGKVVWALCG
ncbi:MAG TPA: ATP-binding protein [Streptosporangiaceae bacterium]|jgi:anti-sigma regulatory factor (Ser/Thr protein kinase)